MLYLTPAGEQVADHARALQERQRELLATLGSQNEDEPLTIATGEGALRNVLNQGLREISKRDRQRLRIVTADAEASIDLVQRGRADLGVAVVDEFPASLSLRRICRIGQKLVVPSGHALASRKRISIGALHGERMIVPPLGRPHRAMVARAFRDADVCWEPAVEVSSWETMAQMVGLGFGVAIINENVRLPRGVVGIALPMLPAVEYHAFWLAASTRRKRIDTFVDAMVTTTKPSAA
jgi:LysR family transcriptional regulator, low CO2-responsive transcriptional regulator